jgi:hypothetical protein
MRRIGLLLLLLVSAPLLTQCRRPLKESDPLFQHSAPQSPDFKKEITYLINTGQLLPEEKQGIEESLDRAQAKFAVPKSLLWCLLFQESRFDTLKNAAAGSGARGLGQFTRHALREINDDTDHFDPRTQTILNQMLTPARIPLTFDFKVPDGEDPADRKLRKIPPQKRNSYFFSNTAVFASAAYLNNRYRQLKRALDRQDIPYDPQVLWLYAAAAYNKGSRTIYSLLTQQRMYGGHSGISELLQNPKLSYALLTHRDLLDFSLRDLFPPETREKYVTELTRNMELVFSCVVPEASL